MALTARRIEDLFARLGKELSSPVSLCIFGSTPAILTGQPDRQTQDIDVWQPKSAYDAADLRRACERAGVLYDPRGEVAADDVYIQFVRPGIVTLPDDFETETIGRYGALTVVMPAPVVLAAAKLVRASEIDIDDVVWWVRHRGISIEQMENAVRALPSPRARETAGENLVLVELVVGRD